jgi:hypothetical protein
MAAAKERVGEALADATEPGCEERRKRRTATGAVIALE